MEVEQWVALGVCAVACLFDLRSRRIPNALTLSAAVAALCFHAAQNGLPGAGLAIVGWLAGAALFFPLFALGGMGAGDVKLLAALGAWLGPYHALWIALYASIAGGVLAVVVALLHGYLGQAVANVRGLLLYWRIVGLKPHPDLVLKRPPGAPRLAFAVPIALGVVLTIWLQ
jgi:prepilin peptidase CpaA